jgi:hypothetical protein
MAPNGLGSAPPGGFPLTKHLSCQGNCRISRDIFLLGVQAFTRSKPLKPDNPQLKSRVADG